MKGLSSKEDCHISDKEFIPLRTGIEDYKLLKRSPKHILDNSDQSYEPCYIHQEYLLEKCLRREAERLAHHENLMNRVVYDTSYPQQPKLSSIVQMNSSTVQ